LGLDVKRLLFIVLFVMVSSNAYALSSQECDCILEETRIELSLAPEYDWGSDRLKVLYPDTWQEERKKRGVMGDCSGKVWAITSKEMAAGKGRWTGKNVPFSRAPAASLVFFTFKKDRIDGHVGLSRRDTFQMKNDVANASATFNKFRSVPVGEDVDNNFFKYLSQVREID
jgi:hypothetical protein